jgi:hypothetical protein
MRFERVQRAGAADREELRAVGMAEAAGMGIAALVGVRSVRDTETQRE